MRFADLQRTYLSSLAYDLTSLRGLSYRTKTCKSGCPFGLLCRGFLSSGSFNWVFRYLQEIDYLYSKLGRQPNEIDFIVPSLDQLGQDECPGPMTYPEALHHCRYFLSLPWRKSPINTEITAQHYTVHGLKSTLLSFANQLQLAPELRRLQGKHKDPLQSTRLYSRDDVNGALQLQEEIITAVQKGWRPHTPLGRGGQIPIQEQEFTLEKFKKDAGDPQWSFFAFTTNHQSLKLIILIQWMQNSPRVPHPHQTPASLHRLPLSKRPRGTPKQFQIHLMRLQWAFFDKRGMWL